MKKMMSEQASAFCQEEERKAGREYEYRKINSKFNCFHL